MRLLSHTMHKNKFREFPWQVSGQEIHASTAEGPSVIPGQRTKVPQAMQHGKKKKKSKQVKDKYLRPEIITFLEGT